MIDFSSSPLPGNQPPTDAQKAQIRSILGLGSVDNTSDATKPVSSAQQAALNLKAPLANPTFTGTVNGLSKAMVGLGNVTNTSDDNKPVSSAQQAALNLKANLISPTFSGTVTAAAVSATTFTGNLTGTVSGNVSGSAASFTGDLGGEVTGKQNATAIAATTVTSKLLTGYNSVTGTIATSDTILSAIGKLNGNAGLKAPLDNPTFTGTVSGITKTMVQLGSVDNTSDTAKPLSAASITALNLKANLASPSFSGTVQLPAGSSSAPPLKFTSGTSLTTAVFGAMEFDGTNLYLTNNVGNPARKMIAFTDSQLTTGSVGSSQLAAGSVGNFQLASNLTLGGTTTGSFNGNLTGNASTATTAASFSGNLAGDVTGPQGTTAIAAATVTGKVLTGLNTTIAGDVTAADTILAAIGKLNKSKANLANPTFTGTVSGINQSMVGLGNVTNTSDANKPVSSAQQAALDLKANLASPTFTGTVQLGTGNVTAAPLKFNPGTLLTTPALGAVEFSVDKLHVTTNTSSGIARRVLAFTDSPSFTGPLTANSIYADSVSAPNVSGKLQALAGTATEPSLVITAGVILTTPRLGAVEFNATDFFLTTGTVAAPLRKKVALQNTSPVFDSLYSSNLTTGVVAATGQVSAAQVHAGSLKITGDATSYNAFLQSVLPSNLGVTATGNVGVGVEAMASLTDSSRNTAVGYLALRNANTGHGNTAIGASALENNITGFRAVAVGNEALRSMTVGPNSAVGDGALRTVTTGVGNVGVGYNAGIVSISGQAALTTGKNNTILGQAAGVSASWRTQSIALGHRATTQNDGELAIGAATAPIRGGTTNTPYNVTDHGIAYTVTAPANTTTPVGWLDARINGTLFKIPLYQ